MLADVSIATGSLTIGLMLTGRFVFQYLGWGVAAVATPVVMALSGTAFFGMSLASQFGLATQFGPYNLAAAGVMAGAVTQVSGLSPLVSYGAPCDALHTVNTSVGSMFTAWLAVQYPSRICLVLWTNTNGTVCTKRQELGFAQCLV